MGFSRGIPCDSAIVRQLFASRKCLNNFERLAKTSPQYPHTQRFWASGGSFTTCVFSVLVRFAAAARRRLLRLRCAASRFALRFISFSGDSSFFGASGLGLTSSRRRPRAHEAAAPAAA